MAFRELIDEFKVGMGQDNYTIRQKFIDMTNVDDNECGKISNEDVYRLPYSGDINVGIPADTFIGYYPDGMPLNGAFKDAYDYNVNFSKLHCINVECTPFQYKTHNIMCYTVDWGTAPAEDIRIITNLKIGTEIMSIDNESTQNGIVYRTSLRQIPYNYSKIIVTADYTVSQIFSTFTGAAKFTTYLGLPDQWMSDYVGKVEPAVPESAPATQKYDGFWLFGGCDIDEYVMRDGKIWFKRTEHYKYRRINDNNFAGPTISWGGWNTIWNTFDKTWDTTNPGIYLMTPGMGWFARLMPII